MRSLQWYKRGAAYEPPINTKGVRGEELVVTLHGRNSLYIKYLCCIGEE